MTSVIEIMLLLGLVSPIIYGNDIIFDGYQFNGHNSFSYTTAYTQQDLFSKIEKLLVPFINTIFRYAWR
jgi:hypothetical protein